MHSTGIEVTIVAKGMEAVSFFQLIQITEEGVKCTECSISQALTRSWERYRVLIYYFISPCSVRSCSILFNVLICTFLSQ